MKERPILFSGPMVRALLNGTKTQTRRIINPQPVNRPILATDGAWYDADCVHPGVPMNCKQGVVGNQLWVKETFYCDHFAANDYRASSSYLTPRPTKEQCESAWRESCYYRADKGESSHPSDHACEGFEEASWKPSIFMWRWASRITLEITAVRVERLNEISEADAIAEGIENTVFKGEPYWKNYLFKTAHPKNGVKISDVEHRIRAYGSKPVNSYRSLWESINGPGSWAINPWVWVIEFKKL